MLKRWFPGWAIAVIILMAIGTVWVRLAIVRTTYSISQTERAIRELQQAREQMDLKVTALRSPRRLEILAKSKFGLDQAKAEQIVRMEHAESLEHQDSISVSQSSQGAVPKTVSKRAKAVTGRKLASKTKRRTSARHPRRRR